MSTIERKRHYTDEQIEEGLLAMAFTHSTRRASELVDIPYRTLYDWQTTHKERFERIKAQMAERIAQEHDAMVARLAQQQHKALDVFSEKVGELKASDAASAIRNLAVSQAVHEDKALLHRGKPTERREITLEGSLRKLQAIGLMPSVDSTAIEDAEVVNDQPSDPAQLPAAHTDPQQQRAPVRDSEQHTSSSPTTHNE